MCLGKPISVWEKPIFVLGKPIAVFGKNLYFQSCVLHYRGRSQSSFYELSGYVAILYLGKTQDVVGKKPF